MKSNYFYGDACARTAQKITVAINSEPDFLSAVTATSPRAAGDAIQSLIERKFENAIGGWCAEYSASFARRAMADLAFTDKENFYCIVDVKTHRIDTSFNMPALVSVERLTRFYEDDKNIFAIMMVKYKVVGTQVKVQNIVFCPIEFLDWNCLTIGALGWGQIQIANSNSITINHGQSEKIGCLRYAIVCNDFIQMKSQRFKIALRDLMRSNVTGKTNRIFGHDLPPIRVLFFASVLVFAAARKQDAPYR